MKGVVIKSSRFICYYLFGLTFLVFVVVSCTKKRLRLQRVSLSKQFQVDTVEFYPERNITLVRLITDRAFGKFEMDYALVKKGMNGETTCYKLNYEKGHGFRVSNEYFAFVKSFGETNWGWFQIEKGKIKNELANTNKIVDSLKATYSENVFIRETNGFITVYKNGVVLKSYNYGEFVMKKTNAYFDKLIAGLYKLDNEELRFITRNSDLLFSQDDGIYFVPLPGYGVVRKFRKSEVLNLFDSLVNLKVLPLEVKQGLGNVSD